MERHNGPLPVGPGNNQSDSLDALQGRPVVRQTGKASPRAKTTWLERFRDSDYAGAKSSHSFPFRRDLRKWDYRRLGYADKPYTPRDYSKPISAELEAYYREFKNKGL